MIGAARYFPRRYFASRYWPKVGAEGAAVPLGFLFAALPANRGHAALPDNKGHLALKGQE
jgi:hypothetical protein